MCGFSGGRYRRRETQGPGFRGVSLYVLCCLFFSVIHGRFSCDRVVFRRCYTSYYMSVSSLHDGTRCSIFSVLCCYTEAIIIKLLMACHCILIRHLQPYLCLF